jgi:hypothetical protein
MIRTCTCPLSRLRAERDDYPEESPSVDGAGRELATERADTLGQSG